MSTCSTTSDEALQGEQVPYCQYTYPTDYPYPLTGGADVDKGWESLWTELDLLSDKQDSNGERGS